MPRYFIQLSFDGTAYHGWQAQKNAHTVQAELQQAMETVFRQKTETLGCGRTDAGVHAAEFFAHFDLITSLSGETAIRDVVYKLNSLLPSDIAVQHIFPVKDNANARFHAVSRTYRYFIHHLKNPFLVNRSYFRRRIPDITTMNEAAQLLLSHNDFSCFSKSRTQVKTNLCKIYKAKWALLPSVGDSVFPTGNGLFFEIKADRFLRNMVRAIVGTLLESGDGQLSNTDFKTILESKNRALAGSSVPACGLYLTEIKYKREIFG